MVKLSVPVAFPELVHRDKNTELAYSKSSENKGKVDDIEETPELIEELP